MSYFLLRRLSMAVLVAITVSVVGFLLMRLSGDLAAELAGEGASPADIANLAKLYGLDRPLPVQYVDWAARLVQGDLGQSLFSGQPVAELISQRAGVTAWLAVLALIFSLAVGIPMGVLAAAFANTWIDRVIAVISVLGQAVPNFWFGLMALIVFAVWLGWLPIAGAATPAHFVLPVITLGLSIMPQFVRVTRSGVLDALGADYIRTARSKGLVPWRVFARHALPNALLPVVSLAAVTFGYLLGGSVIVEAVFAINGLGLLAYSAILASDFPVVQAVVVIISFVYVALTLLADLINAWIDPRLRRT